MHVTNLMLKAVRKWTDDGSPNWLVAPGGLKEKRAEPAVVSYRILLLYFIQMTNKSFIQHLSIGFLSYALSILCNKSPGIPHPQMLCEI